MSEASAIWMFLSVFAICWTWHRIATTPRKVEAPPEREINLIMNGQPFNGQMQVTMGEKTTTHKIVDGKIA